MKLKRLLASVFVLAAVLAAACSSAPQQTAPAAANDIPKIDFEKFTLPNGLDVILSEDHRLPLVAVNLWYHVGPANEDPGRTGFAHLFEHMMFQGSKHVPGDGHFKTVEGAGGSDLNGTTDFDRTNYFQTMPADRLETALWLESDRMGYLLDDLDQGKLSNQQDVVRNERRQSVENAPYGIVEEALFHQLFPKDHPYYASVIGSHADIQAAKLEDVKNFFKLYYAPNNASLVIVGDIDKAATKAMVEKYFGTLKRGQPVPKPAVQTPPITRRAASGRAGSRRAAARLHGVVDVADLQAGRRRRRHRGHGARHGAVEPSVQDRWCTRSRSRSRCRCSSTRCRSDPCFRFRRRRGPDTRPTSWRRRSTRSWRSSARLVRKPRRSIGPATASKRGWSKGSSDWAALAASPIA